MNICLIYHSDTGNTKSFAEAIQNALEQKGHQVTNTHLQSLAPIKKASVREHQDISFRNLPKADDYDAILFGGPVWAFGPSPAIIAAIRQMTLKGKKCACFATMGFPYHWMGGNGAIRYMERELGKKGALVLPGRICSRATRDITALRKLRSLELISSL